MTGIGPYLPRYDNTHMWNIKDIRGCNPKLQYDKNSIMDHLHSNPDFTKFAYLVKLAKLDGMLSNVQANVTVFVPSNKAIEKLGDGWVTNADKGWATNLVKMHMVDKRIPSQLLKQSPAYYLLTRNDQNRLFISNINEKTMINNNVNLIGKDIYCTNGIIITVDKLLQPTWPYQET